MYLRKVKRLPVLTLLRAAWLAVALGADSVSAASALPSVPPASAAIGATSFDLDADPDYRNYRQAVVTYLASRHSRADAHVCVLGERDGGGDRTVTVWWKEGARLIQWEGRESKLATSISNLDLKRDVVASEDDLHGSTYLVTRAWVAGFEARCTRSGKSFVVRRAELDAARKHH